MPRKIQRRNSSPVKSADIIMDPVSDVNLVESPPPSLPATLEIEETEDNVTEESLDASELSQSESSSVIEVTNPQKDKAIRKRKAIPEDRPLNETILNTEKVVTLDDVIDERLVNKFYQQAIRPTFNQKLSSLIQEKALLRIKLALMTSFEQVNLPRKAHKKWPEVEENGIFRELTVLEVAEQLRTLFGSPNQSETTIDLDRQLTAIVFSFLLQQPALGAKLLVYVYKYCERFLSE